MGSLTFPSINKQALYQLSVSDLSSRLDPDGKVAPIAEVLTETNEILLDMPYVEGNLPTGHRVTLRTGLPKAYWKRMNQGVPPSKSSVASVEETCGKCQARSIIDADELELNGNTSAYRASEDRAFIEAMNQTMTRTLFYGDKKDAVEGFVGFAPRYNTLDPRKAECAKNVIDCGGTGNNLTSIWIVGWSTDTVFGIYPKGTSVGLKVVDKGLIRVLDENGYPYDAYESVYTWSNGLVVKDWRYVVRLCNIDVNALLQGKGLGAGDINASNQNLITQLSLALAKIPAQGNARICMYMNPDVHAVLNAIAARANSNVLQIESSLNAYGEHTSWTSFLGHPMRRVDALQATEKQITR